MPAGVFAGMGLSGPESAVGMMRWRLEKRGRKVSSDIALAGTDGEKRLRAEAEAWLAFS